MFVPFPFELGIKELSIRLSAVKPSCIVIWSGYLEKLREEIDKVSAPMWIFINRVQRKERKTCVFTVRCESVSRQTLRLYIGRRDFEQHENIKYNL